MSDPKNPQGALCVQHAVIATVWLAMASMVVIALVVIFNTPTLTWGPRLGLLGVIGMYALLFAAVLRPARTAAENYRQHSVGDNAHHCQCRDCGRTFTPAPGSPTGRPRATASPQQRGAAARAMVGISPFVGLVLFVALIAAVVIDAVGGQTEAFPLVFIVGLLIAHAVGLVIVVVVAQLQRRATDREIARRPPQHGCTCSWCGRRNTQLPSNAGQPYPA